MPEFWELQVCDRFTLTELHTSSHVMLYIRLCSHTIPVLVLFVHQCVMFDTALSVT